MRSIASTARTAATFNQTAQLFDSVPAARKWLHNLLKRLYAYKVDRVTGDVLPRHRPTTGWYAVRYGLNVYHPCEGPVFAEANYEFPASDFSSSFGAGSTFDHGSSFDCSSSFSSFNSSWD
jgi:hypothetical protein